MGFLNLNISKAKYLKVKKSNLCITLDNDEERNYLISDLNFILLDNLQTGLTTSVLNELSKNKVAFLLCDEKHLPQTILTPYNSHFQSFKVYKWQTGVSTPTEKQIWQTIIKRKILNQSKCLEILKFPYSKELADLSKEVLSGDSDNTEATAANLYFKVLFENKFKRRDDNFINSALNYGYAIIRSVIAREVAVTGLLPFLGINHINELNNFNLVDDLIEPYRSFVDYYIMNEFYDKEGELSPVDKRFIFSILNCEVLINGMNVSFQQSVQKLVESYVASLKENKNQIILPELTALKGHRYE